MHPAKAGSASGLYFRNPSSNSPSSKKRKSTSTTTSPRKNRSIWNSNDDWDELISNSTLSTASVSQRAPRPHGLPTLVQCCITSASRGWKILWEDGRSGAVDLGSLSGLSWKYEWRRVPDQLKGRIRNQVYRWWGSVLTLRLLQEFLVPPELNLPGDILPSIAELSRIHGILPPSKICSQITTLVLTHAPKIPDSAIAKLISDLPNLEALNLKGSISVGSETVSNIVARCKRLRKINLKSSQVDEEGVKLLLDSFGHQLEVFKVDKVRFLDPESTFAGAPFPEITHLCLPGDVINTDKQAFRIAATARNMAHALPPPKAKPAPPGALFDWNRLGNIFPSLTHLYLPGLLIPEKAVIQLPSNTLQKLSLGKGGPPVPVDTISELVEAQSDSLRHVSLGHLTLYNSSSEEEFARLGEALAKCKLETFRFEAEARNTTDMKCDLAMQSYSALVYQEALRTTWVHSLKHLTICLPIQLDEISFAFEAPNGVVPILEELNIPGMQLLHSESVSRSLAKYRCLRSLDVSGTAFTDDDIFEILDSCSLISRINLTSCRGVRVQNRRNIFKAWEESRRPTVEPTKGRTRRSKK